MSFGPDPPGWNLGPLNVLIGPNGSGEVELHRGACVAAGGAAGLGCADPREPAVWASGLHKCASRVPNGTLEAVVEYPEGRDELRYRLTIEERQHRFRVRDECIEDDVVNPGQEQTRRHFG